MPKPARPKPLSGVSGGRLRLAAAIFLGTAAMAFAVGYYLASQYTAAAILTHAVPPDPSAEVESQKGLFTDEEISTLNQRLHLYPDVVMKFAPRWTVARTRSNVSTTSAPDPASGEVQLRIAYTGRQKETVVRATNALAMELSQSRLQATHAEPGAPEETANAASESSDSPTATSTTFSKQKSAVQQTALQNSAASLAELRRQLDQAGQRQTAIETQMRQQTSALIAIQQQRLSLGTTSREKIASDRQRQLNKHDADESALRSQVAAAMKNMSDLGQHYRPDSPEYLKAKARVDKLQAMLNEYQSKPLVLAPEISPDNAKQLIALSRQETTINGTLQALQQELDRNEAESRRIQTMAMRWSEGSTAPPATVKTLPTVKTAEKASTPPAQSDADASLSFHPEYTILEYASLVPGSPPINFQQLALVSLAFGLISAITAFPMMAKPRKVLRSEEDLLHLLPEGIRYLGVIPRIKHEIIPG